jgi:ribosomal protein L30/L7E
VSPYPALSTCLTNLRLTLSTPPALVPTTGVLLSVSPESTATKITQFRITLRCSAISLGEKKQETLAALGLHRRNQTVSNPHKPDIAAKILAVKELLEVRNVPASEVRNKQEQRVERKAHRGYEVVESRLGGLDGV